MKLTSIVAFSLLLAIGNAMADDNIQQGLQNKHDFMTMKAHVVKGIADRDDQYREMSPDDQKKLNDTLDRMTERWSKADDVAGLSQGDRVEMANDQEVVTMILNHSAADSRLVCERVPTIGSNLPKNVCKTVGQRAREQKEAQDAARAGTLEGSN